MTRKKLSIIVPILLIVLAALCVAFMFVPFQSTAVISTGERHYVTLVNFFNPNNPEMKWYGYDSINLLMIRNLIIMLVVFLIALEVGLLIVGILSLAKRQNPSLVTLTKVLLIITTVFTGLIFIEGFNRTLAAQFGNNDYTGDARFPEILVFCLIVACEVMSLVFVDKLKRRIEKNVD